ncbi:MAG TPA: tripartite tricarboxylate transporter substrate binding protein [Burkholderiaceae bacterium]|nr:tripartite tricarboxylate transporter substrate binding protein [Burkholderiaceae bacterium]
MRQWLKLALSAALAAGVTGALAQTSAPGYPNKTIRIVVPFPPGGSTDLIGRRLAEKFSASMGQPVIVENRPGAGGTVGSEYAARAAPDGHTLLVGVTGSHGISVSLNPKLPYHPLKDFEPVSALTTTPLVLVVGPQFPAATLAEYVAHARSKPGEVTHSSPGNGTSMHLTGEMFNLVAGTKLVHVPYRGSAGAINDLIGGQVQSMFADLLVAMPFIQAGRIRALALTSPKRHELLPNVPTVAESGYPGFEALSWQGLFVPAGTPAEIVERLSRETVSALQSPDVRDSFAKQGMEVRGSSPAEFRAFVEREIPKWAKIIQQAGVTLQ